MTLRNSAGNPVKMLRSTTDLCEGSFDGVIADLNYNSGSRTITATLADGSTVDFRDQQADAFEDLKAQCGL